MINPFYSRTSYAEIPHLYFLIQGRGWGGGGEAVGRFQQKVMKSIPLSGQTRERKGNAFFFSVFCYELDFIQYREEVYRIRAVPKETIRCLLRKY